MAAMNLEKIYEKGTSDHVGGYVVYAKAADHKLYKEEGFVNQVKAEDALRAFQEGKLVIILSTDMMIASKISLTGETVTINGTAYSTKTEG